MFADEPISGLDAFMAESVIRQLRTLAEAGRCVFATIHQPSTDVYALFSKVRPFHASRDDPSMYRGIPKVWTHSKCYVFCDLSVREKDWRCRAR